MSATVTKTRKSIAFQQVTLEQIIIFARNVKKESDLSEREKALADAVESMAVSHSEILECLSEKL